MFNSYQHDSTYKMIKIPIKYQQVQSTWQNPFFEKLIGTNSIYSQCNTIHNIKGGMRNTHFNSRYASNTQFTLRSQLSYLRCMYDSSFLVTFHHRYSFVAQFPSR